jgi:hypothetical protein
MQRNINTETIEAIIEEPKSMTTGQLIAFFRARKQLDFLETILDYFSRGDKIVIEQMLEKEKLFRRNNGVALQYVNQSIFKG